MKYFGFILSFALILNFAASFEILGVLPFETKSHYAFGNSIMTALAEFFHNVTVVSPYPEKKQLHFYKTVSIASDQEAAEDEEVQVPTLLNLEQPAIIPSLKFMYQSGEETVNYVMNHPNFIELMESGKTFNACIIENTHFEALMGLAEVFECILITYTTNPSVHMIDRMASNISPAAYVPNPFLAYTHKMSYKERFVNKINTMIETIFYEIIHLPNQNRLYQKYFPNAKNSFQNVHKNSSIIFINQHPILFSPRPFTPNMIDIGGIHVQQANPLRKKLQKFLDDATDGVILFSMGSILQGTDWSEEQREAFVKAFGKLKQKVLWKYENKTLPNKPGNVKIKDWLPQRDILAHPNVKLFITHGGLLGTFEAFISGVPILGIPMFGDQNMNIAYAVLHEHGLKLDSENLTEEVISNVIDELLTNSKYKENAEKLSSLYKDRMIPAKMQVIYWTEYVIRHGGAPHLKVEADHLNLMQLHSLDVYATFAVILGIIFYVNFVIFRMIGRKVIKCKILKIKDE